jgi:hypothetical protein
VVSHAEWLGGSGRQSGGGREAAAAAAAAPLSHLDGYRHASQRSHILPLGQPLVNARGLLQGELVVHRYKAAQPGLHRAQATQVCLRQFSGTPAAGGHLLPRSLQGRRLNGKLHVAKRTHCSTCP